MVQAKSRKVQQSTIEAFSSIVEAFLTQIGVNPEKSRLEGHGENRAGWSLRRGSASIYIFLEDSQDRSSLRIESPIVYLPQDNILPFYRRCLEINDGLRDCALAARDDVILLVSDRPLEGLTPEDIVQNIDLLSFAADNLDNEFANEFGVKLFS